jgi:hypothetical protein
MNKSMFNLNLSKFKLKIKNEVKGDGNCWFRSMVSLGYGSNHITFRKGIAVLFLALKDKKGLFPNQPDISLFDMFNNSNEIAHSYDDPSSEFIKYNYDLMCYDMHTLCSWERLPMNLIMQFISLLYDIEFNIVTSYHQDKLLKVSWNESLSFSKVVYLGKYSEAHYVPLESDNIEFNLNDNIDWNIDNYYINSDSSDINIDDLVSDSDSDNDEILNYDKTDFHHHANNININTNIVNTNDGFHD